MTQNNNNVIFLTNLWVDQMVLLSHVVYIWNPGMAKKYRMVSLVWISWTGFSTYLPWASSQNSRKVPKGSKSRSKGIHYKSLKPQYLYSITCAVFYSLKEVKDQPRFKGRELNPMSTEKEIVKNCGHPNKQRQKGFMAKAKDPALPKECLCLIQLN